jgi:hypothetical protein
MGREAPHADDLAGAWSHLDIRGPFPEGLHLIALLVGFYGELCDLIRRFCRDAADLVETWDATTGAPIDDTLQGMLERALRLIDPTGSPDRPQPRGTA